MSVKKLFYSCVLLCVLLCVFLVGCHSSNEKRIGIVVPIQHKAMDEIVAGFVKTLQKQNHGTLTFKVANAQGDINLERAIIQQMKDEGYEMVVPIGTDATQMTSAMIQHQPIVSLAADFSQNVRDKLKSCNIAIVHDEISPATSMQFIHAIYPSLHSLVLIHSTSDKVIPQVKETIAARAKYGITVKPLMVSTLNDIYSVANNMPADTQGIFVLKDNLVVSGIATLSITAQKKHIPLITSDQGSVQDGAGVALGVHERQIGIDGANLAEKILKGSSPCSLPIVEMKKLTVFINKDALQNEQQSIDNITIAALKAHYPVENVKGDE